METNIQPQMNAEKIIAELNQTVIWLTDNAIQLSFNRAIPYKEKKSANWWFDGLITRLQRFIKKLRDPEGTESVEWIERIANTLRYEQVIANGKSAFYELPLFDTGVKLIDSRAGEWMVCKGTSMIPSIYPESVIEVRPVDQSDFGLVIGRIVAVAHRSSEKHCRDWWLGRLHHVSESTVILKFDNPAHENKEFVMSEIRVLGLAHGVSVITEESMQEEGGQDHE